MLRAVLLGPKGQLGTDIRGLNESCDQPLDITCIGRSQLDLSDLDATARALRNLEFHVLINCSSYHKTDEVERNADLAFRINAHLVRLLSEICMDKKARFVHFSTDYVFGGGGHSEPIPEVAAKAPINVYGASKCMGENLAALVGCDTLILRVASLFGVAGASGKGGNFVETMLRLGKERGLLNVVNDQYMSPTATADVADATLKLIGVGAPAGIWHVVNTGAASWYDFAKQIVACSGIAAEVNPIQSSDYPTPARRPSYSVLSNSKLGSALGEIRTWKEALKDYMIAKGYG